MLFRYIIQPFRGHRRNRKWIFRILLIYIIMLIPNFFRTGHRSYRSHDAAEDIFYFRLKRFEDYAALESNRTGPGEQGSGHSIPTYDTYKDDFKREGMNIRASDQIALDRSLAEVRSSSCLRVAPEYPRTLPSASVIVIYYNEAWSPILRTVHSVVNRSPPQYLHEVVLLDDSSTRPELLEPLSTYIAETWPDGIVRQVRTDTRQGLIGARQVGAKAARGDVIIFLDAHCEVSRGWLEPLLVRIGEKRTAVVCPIIDQITEDTLAFRHGGVGAVGGFSWSGHFTWWTRHHSTLTAPYSSPTMAGGLFAMDREFFFELGGYDTKMEIWGGENLEMSFRIWMCGGSLEFAPCSRVGHIFRATHPYGFPDKKRDYHGLNTARMVEVWMDDYKRLFYYFRPSLQTAEYGDVTERRDLRKQLQCHSFKWFLQNVYPEKFIYDERCIWWGQIRNPSKNLCLSTLGVDEKIMYRIGLSQCRISMYSSQMFTLSLQKELRRETTCADVHTQDDGEQVKMVHCHGSRGNQEWVYKEDTQEIYHPATRRCLDGAGSQEKNQRSVYATVNKCTGAETQRWEIEHRCDTSE